jgi:ATP-dependent protease ClpP protease subunit
MSVVATKIRKDTQFPATAGRNDRASITSALSVAANIARRVAVKSARLFMHAVDAIAEARTQRALIEAELYRNRYRHSSKNDDDLPVVR